MKNYNLDINNTIDVLNCRLETGILPEKNTGKLQKRAKEIIHDTKQRHREVKTH